MKKETWTASSDMIFESLPRSKAGGSSLESPDYEARCEVTPILFRSGNGDITDVSEGGRNKMEFVILGIVLVFLIAFGLGHLA